MADHENGTISDSAYSSSLNASQRCLKDVFWEHICGVLPPIHGTEGNLYYETFGLLVDEGKSVENLLLYSVDSLMLDRLCLHDFRHNFEGGYSIAESGGGHLTA